MDKWEQVAEGIVTDWDYEDILKWTSLKVMIGEALRQCEADTIRRCAEELSDAAANYADSEHSDVRMLWLASKTILALLPEE